MSITVIRGARIPQPDGSLSTEQDIYVDAGRITRIHPATRITTGHTLDAQGRIALPGLIDAHTHADAAIFQPDIQLALLRQGVTSVVTGQDGVGFAPSPIESRYDAATWASGYFAAINGQHPTFHAGSFRELLASYDHTTAINVAACLPHGTLRYAVMGASDQPATPLELAELVRIAEQAFRDGACALSTGLEYVPAAYADAQELTALTAVAQRFGAVHSSHMRGYEERAPEAFAELMRLAQATGVATHIAHYHGPAEVLIPLIDTARANGIDVTFDSYPYLRGCSILAMVALPTWLPIADRAASVAALRDDAVLDRLHHEHAPGLSELWPRMTLASVPGEMSWAEGMTLIEVALRLNTSAAHAVIRLLVTSELRATCIFAQPPSNSAESVRQLANHPAHLAGSDAIYSTGVPHPRGWGTFARFFKRHREFGDWNWHDAIEHLSARAARRFHLGQRGSLTVGSVADIALVDPHVHDHATYENPRALATGIDDVLVAGVPVLTDGALTGYQPGIGLRPTWKGQH